MWCWQPLPGTGIVAAQGLRVEDSRDGRHVVVELLQELWEAEWLVHADDFLQLLSCVGREGDPPQPGDKTEGWWTAPGQDPADSSGGHSWKLGDLSIQLLPLDKWES